MLRNFPSNPSFPNVFILKGYWTLSVLFCFFPFLLMWYIDWVYYIEPLGINPTFLTSHLFFSLGEFQVRLNRDKSRASVSQIASREVRTDRHNNLSFRSALLPLEPGTRIPHWERWLMSSRFLLY